MEFQLYQRLSPTYLQFSLTSILIIKIIIIIIMAWSWIMQTKHPARGINHIIQISPQDYIRRILMHILLREIITTTLHNKWLLLLDIQSLCHTFRQIIIIIHQQLKTLQATPKICLLQIRCPIWAAHSILNYSNQCYLCIIIISHPTLLELH